MGNTTVGSGVGGVDRRKADGPIKLKMKLDTMMRLKIVVMILAFRLLRFWRLERPTLSS